MDQELLDAAAYAKLLQTLRLCHDVRRSAARECTDGSSDLDVVLSSCITNDISSSCCSSGWSAGTVICVSSVDITITQCWTHLCSWWLFNHNGCVLFQNLTNLDRSRFVRSLGWDQSSPVTKNTQMILVTMGVVIWFSSVQYAEDHALFY